MFIEASTPAGRNIFPESKLAHQILDGLQGLEIGPACHNPFGLKTRSVGLTADQDPEDYEFFRQVQLQMCGSFSPIDIPGDAAKIPVPDNSVDFVLHSHVWEHLPYALSALDEWVRVVRPDGFVFAIVPKRDAAPLDKERPLTSFAELLKHYHEKEVFEDGRAQRKGSSRGHYTVFSPQLLRQIAAWFNRAHFWARLDELAYQETDDKVGNGHTIVWQVRKFSRPIGFGSACLSRLNLWRARNTIGHQINMAPRR